MQKTGQIERTVDREYAEEEAKYKMCVHQVTARYVESTKLMILYQI